MKDYKIELLTLIIATITTISFLVFNYNYEKHQILTLSILTILLPVIYQVGFTLSKEKLRSDKDRDYDLLQNYLEDVEEENEVLNEYIKEGKFRK